MDKKLKFSQSKTFLLGFGFLGVSMIWAMYNAYLPVFLRETFQLPFSLVGAIMTIDNVFAILLLPFLGALSDSTNTKIGKRRPYILVGAPLAMIFFILIPFVFCFCEDITIYLHLFNLYYIFLYSVFIKMV